MVSGITGHSRVAAIDEKPGSNRVLRDRGSSSSVRSGLLICSSNGEVGLPLPDGVLRYGWKAVISSSVLARV